MSVRVKRPSGRPSFVQRMTEDALESIATDLIVWQKKNDRVASGESQEWTVFIKRKGNKKEVGIGPNIEGRLVGVDYINFALFGRAPGGVPYWGLILDWMKIRGIPGGPKRARQIAWGIARYGTSALKLSTAVRSAIFDRSVNGAIDEYAPKVAEQSAKDLVNRFEGATDKFRNVQVNVSS